MIEAGIEKTQVMYIVISTAALRRINLKATDTFYIKVVSCLMLHAGPLIQSYSMIKKNAL